MGSLLTALASIGSQYSEGKEAARKEKLDESLQQQELESRKAFLGLQQEAQRRLSDELEFKKKQGEIIELDPNKTHWSVSKGKIVDLPRPNPVDALKDWIKQQPKAIQDELESTARTSLEIEPGKPGEAFKAVEQIAKTYKADQEKKNRTDPIISAQIGPRPSPEAYAKGEKDPAYTAAVKKWGIDAETVKNRIASAGAEARGKAYGQWRFGPYVDNEGAIHTASAGEAEAKGWIPYQPAFQSMTRTAQMAEMQNASFQLRSAIQNLTEEDAFSPEQVFLLKAAANQLSANGNQSMFESMISTVAAKSLNERQMDYVLWIQQMGERILSLRPAAGMGQGAQDLREAIQATLPGFTSGTKTFALRKLDAVDNQINLLSKGIPSTNINKPPSPPQGAKTLDQVLDEKFGAKPK